MVRLPREAGYQPVVATDEGTALTGKQVSLTPDLKLSDVVIADYVGVLVPCMGFGMGNGLAPEGVALVRQAADSNLPVAAQNGGSQSLEEPVGGSPEGGSQMASASINGININYKAEGEGEALVLIAGISQDLRSLDAAAAAFKKHFKVIRLDNRGTGKSDGPSGACSIRTMAEDVICLMDHLDVEKASVLGYSMGGLIAQEIAINYPHRVNKLLLCATFSCQDEDSGMTPELAKVAALPWAQSIRGFMGLLFNSPVRRLLFTILSKLVDKKAFRATFELQAAAIANHNARDRLGLIKAPTLVVVGTNDRLIRTSSSEVLAREIPGAKLVKITNGSHMLFAESGRSMSDEVLHFL